MLLCRRDYDQIECLIVEPVQVADISLHIHGNLLPGLEAEISLFKNGFVFLVADAFDGGDDIRVHIGRAFVTGAAAGRPADLRLYPVE